MANRIQLRRDTAANWTRENPILSQGEPGLETDTNKIKYGDGSTSWAGLPYASGGASTSTRWDLTSQGNGCPISAELTSEHFEAFTEKSNLGIRSDGSWNIGSNYNGTGLYSLNNTATLYSNYGDVVIRINESSSYFTFGADGTLTLPNGGTISDGKEIRLQPAGASSSTQALLIYPTAQDGNQIHLTADGGETDLYLGDDNQYVKVDHSGTIVVGTLGANTSTWIFGTDGNLTIPATGDIVRDGTSIFASSTALPVVTITNANFNQSDTPLPPATSTSEGAVVFTVTSPVALTATGLLLISGSNNKGGTIVTGGTTTGSQTLAFDMGGLNSTFTVVAFATTANGTSYSAPAGGHGGYVCFPAGTMITLSNGTKKAIEDIIYSDDLLVWDFDQGAYASAKPIWIKASETASEYNLLTFSDGSVLKTVGNHHIFNKHAERFTHTMTADTPIGTVSFNEYGEEISLVSAEVVKETVEFYNVWTEYHLNMFAEGVLTSNRFNNTYPIVGMKFAKGNKELRPMTEFNGLDPKWIHGLRLQEQTAEHTAEYIKWYVSERLEKLSIDSTQLAG